MAFAINVIDGTALYNTICMASYCHNNSAGLAINTYNSKKHLTYCTSIFLVKCTSIRSVDHAGQLIVKWQCIKYGDYILCQLM